MTDNELLDLLINNPGIQKNLNQLHGITDKENWSIISDTTPVGTPLEFNWEFFENNTPAFSYMRAAAYFKNEKKKEMFLIFHDMSWTAHSGETGTLVGGSAKNDKDWKKDVR